jgi:ABC-2 type transport system ATP-binding protein
MLDEPTVGVDPQTRNAIFENIRALKEQGLTVLYTTHYMEEAELLCDRVAIMDEGQIIALDAPQCLVNKLGTGIIHIGLRDTGGRMLRGLQALPQIQTVSRRDNIVQLEAVDVQQALVEIIAFLMEAEMPLTSLEILQPSLESVFIRLTGRQLRD